MKASLSQWESECQLSWNIFGMDVQDKEDSGYRHAFSCEFSLSMPCFLPEEAVKNHPVFPGMDEQNGKDRGEGRHSPVNSVHRCHDYIPKSLCEIIRSFLALMDRMRRIEVKACILL